jgi:hypothetical protein
MKKILVLMLVVGFASMATAALSLTVNGYPAEDSSIILAPSDTVMIGLYTNAGDHTIGYLSIAEGDPGSWTGVYHIYRPPAIDSAYAYYYGPITGMGDTWILFDANAGIPRDPDIFGIIGEFEFHCDGGPPLGQVQISYIDSATGLVDTLIIHVPEPMSIALLGFGALALRRRK